MGNELRILYVSKTMPHPPDIGMRQRVLGIGRLMKRLGPVTFLGLARNPSAAGIEATRKEFDKVVMLKPPRWAEPRTTKIARALGLSRSGATQAMLSDEQLDQFRRLRAECDVVWILERFVADMLGVFRFEHSVLDMNDLEHVKLSLEADLAGWPVARWRLRRASREAKVREIELQDRFSRLVLCSQEDRGYLASFMDASKFEVVPNGFDPPAEKPSLDRPVELRLGIVGHLGYQPNRDGIEWFAREIWPRVRRQVPQARLRVMGRLPEDTRFLQYEAVDALGFVENAGSEIASWAAMIVPLRIGGGTRIKIVEAFSRMCPVVSTTVGAYGIDAVDQRDLFIADDPDLFARRCATLLEQPAAGRALADNAWRLFQQRYTWDRIFPQVEAAVRAAAGTNILH